MNKKYLLSAISILALILIVIMIALLLPNNKKNSSSPSKPIMNTIMPTDCQPYRNLSVATETGDSAGCDCLPNPVLIKQCQTNISDIGLSAKALKEVDLSACELISSAEIKSNCLKLVQGKLDFSTKN